MVHLSLFIPRDHDSKITSTCLHVGAVSQKVHEQIFKLQEPCGFSFVKMNEESDEHGRFETDAYDCLVGHVAAKDLVMILPSSPSVRYLEYLDPKLPVFVYWS